jgi:hypothetical protein
MVLSSIACVISGCAPALHQRLAPYPAYGQAPERMARDNAECESWARYTAGSAGDSTAGGAVGGAAVGAATGAALGAIAGAFLGDAGSGAAIGAAFGGASGGMQGAAGGAVDYDQRLLAAYGNCMTARGYAVNGFVAQAPPPEERSLGQAEHAMTSIEDRLLRLRHLHDESLITDKEYRDRRRAVLEEL